MTHNKVFDEIVLTDDTIVYGIVDFTATKHVYFFDFSKEKSIDMVFHAILWRGNSPGIRFSIYMALENPSVYLPRAILIPIKGIKSSTIHIIKPQKIKERRTILVRR